MEDLRGNEMKSTVWKQNLFRNGKGGATQNVISFSLLFCPEAKQIISQAEVEICLAEVVEKLLLGR